MRHPDGRLPALRRRPQAWRRRGKRLRKPGGRRPSIDCPPRRHVLEDLVSGNQRLHRNCGARVLVVRDWCALNLELWHDMHWHHAGMLPGDLQTDQPCDQPSEPCRLDCQLAGLKLHVTWETPIMRGGFLRAGFLRPARAATGPRWPEERAEYRRQLRPTKTQLTDGRQTHESASTACQGPACSGITLGGHASAIFSEDVTSD